MSNNIGIERRVLEYMRDYGILPPEGGSMLCAVSGGADSMCLLSLMRELLPPLGIGVLAAHYNHHLRGEESDRDENFVRDWCQNNGITVYVGSGDVNALASERSLGIEEAAREARYAFLQERALQNGCTFIATAHNAEDNLETMLINLARGSGTRGLGGIPTARDNIARPLLFLTRAEIESLCRERGVPFVTDSSNLTLDYSRNKIRHAILPVLREINPSCAGNAMRTARLMREDDDYLNSLAGDFLDANMQSSALPAAALANLPRPVASRAVRLMTPRSLGEAHVQAVLELARSKSPSACLDLPGIRVQREYDMLVFARAKPGIIACREISPGDNFELYPSGPRVFCAFEEPTGDIYSSLNTFFFKTDSICGKMYVGSRFPGDSVRFKGRSVTKTLRKLFIEERIPRERRSLVPVVRDEGGVLAVGGFGISEHAAAKPGDKAIKIEIVEGWSNER